jgi:predicted transcriptional regulator
VRIVLAEREAELMEVLWERGPSTVAQVQESLEDPLAYTTVLTVLRKLEAKGYVRHEEEGRAHRFEAAVARDAARRSAVRDLARKLFKGSTELLLSHAVADERLTPEQVKRIGLLLRRASKQDMQ